MTYKKALPTAIQGIGVIALLVSSQGAMAADWDLSGFIRQEGAYSLDNGAQTNPTVATSCQARWCTESSEVSQPAKKLGTISGPRRRTGT